MEFFEQCPSVETRSEFFKFLKPNLKIYSVAMLLSGLNNGRIAC
jgi:hypothetical protein